MSRKCWVIKMFQLPKSIPMSLISICGIYTKRFMEGGVIEIMFDDDELELERNNGGQFSQDLRRIQGGVDALTEFQTLTGVYSKESQRAIKDLDEIINYIIDCTDKSIPEDDRRTAIEYIQSRFGEVDINKLKKGITYLANLADNEPLNDPVLEDAYKYFGETIVKPVMKDTGVKDINELVKLESERLENWRRAFVNLYPDVGSDGEE